MRQCKVGLEYSIYVQYFGMLITVFKIYFVWICKDTYWLKYLRQIPWQLAKQTKNNNLNLQKTFATRIKSKEQYIYKQYVLASTNSTN